MKYKKLLENILDKRATLDRLVETGEIAEDMRAVYLSRTRSLFTQLDDLESQTERLSIPERGLALLKEAGILTATMTVLHLPYLKRSGEVSHYKNAEDYKRGRRSLLAAPRFVSRILELKEGKTAADFKNTVTAYLTSSDAQPRYQLEILAGSEAARIYEKIREETIDYFDRDNDANAAASCMTHYKGEGYSWQYSFVHPAAAFDTPDISIAVVYDTQANSRIVSRTLINNLKKSIIRIYGHSVIRDLLEAQGYNSDFSSLEGCRMKKIPIPNSTKFVLPYVDGHARAVDYVGEYFIPSPRGAVDARNYERATADRPKCKCCASEMQVSNQRRVITSPGTDEYQYICKHHLEDKTDEYYHLDIGNGYYLQRADIAQCTDTGELLNAMDAPNHSVYDLSAREREVLQIEWPYLAVPTNSDTVTLECRLTHERYPKQLMAKLVAQGTGSSSAKVHTARLSVILSQGYTYDKGLGMYVHNSIENNTRHIKRDTWQEIFPDMHADSTLVTDVITGEQVDYENGSVVVVRNPLTGGFAFTAQRDLTTTDEQ